MSDILNNTLPEPSFIARDPAAVVQAWIAGYETLTGKTLYPAQIERLLANNGAYRESLMRAAIQDMGLQALVRYARAPMLDHLGQNIGVTRLAGEDDASLRERIWLAPEQFSNAGSAGAYRFHARSASSAIVDVAVVGPDLALLGGNWVSSNGVPAGQVRLHPLTKTGLPSAAVKDAVYTACNADTVRPLTDYVQVLDPVRVGFVVVAHVRPYKNADAQVAMSAAQAAADTLAAHLRAGLGRDIVRSQWIAALQAYGVYQVELLQPAADRVLAAYEWADCSSITLTQLEAQHG